MASPARLCSANSSGVTQRSTGRWSFVGCRYWPIVTRSQPASRRSASASVTSDGRLAHPQDEVRLRDLARRGGVRRSAARRASGRSRTPAGSGRAAVGPSPGCARTRRAAASITVAMSRSPPLKSVGSTSTPQPGTASRTARIVAAQIRAPPSGRSSRATPVTTTNRSPICRTAEAIRAGSSSSTGSGAPSSRRRSRSGACTGRPGSGTSPRAPPSIRRCSGTSPPRTRCAGRGHA